MSTAFKFNPEMATLPQASLAKIDISIFPNNRDQFAEDYEASVEGLRESISAQGLMQPPVLSPHGDKFAAVAGFTRILALTQLALLPLAAAANKNEDGTPKKKDDPTYININKAADRERLRNIDPAAYDKVLEDTYIPYTPKMVENKGVARILNATENMVRNDMSPLDTSRVIYRILTDKEYPMKAKRLSQEFGKGWSEGKISQYRKLAEFETLLPEFLTTPQDGETFTEDQLAQLKTTVKALMDDYVKRLGFKGTGNDKDSKAAARAIDFQHAREFVNRIQPAVGRKPLSRAVALTVFKRLLGWSDQKGMLDPEAKTPDFGMFCQQIDNAVKAEEAVTAGATAPAAGTAVDASAVAGAVPGTVPPVSSPNVPQVPVTTAVGTPPTGAAPAGSAMAGQMEASVANATANAGVESVSADDILDQAGAAAGTAEAAGNGPDGTARKGVKADQAMPQTKDKYAKAKTFIEMDKYCDTLLECAAEEGNRLCDTAGHLGGVSALYEALGMNDERKQVDRSFDDFAERVEDYVKALEEIKEHAIKAGLPLKKGLKELVRPEFIVEAEEAGEEVAATV